MFFTSCNLLQETNFINTLWKFFLFSGRLKDKYNSSITVERIGNYEQEKSSNSTRTCLLYTSTIQSMEPDVEVVERTRNRRKAAETHNHEHHYHHHEHGEECGCGHDHHDHDHDHEEHEHHHHHHEHGEECGCGHVHHDHDHDHEEHEHHYHHHEHGEECGCCLLYTSIVAHGCVVRSFILNFTKRPLSEFWKTP